MTDTSKLNISKEILDSLSEEEQRVLIKTLSEMSEGNDSLYQKLKYAAYDEIPVDIETFLKDKNYLGNGLIDPEGRFTVFPFWVETLKKIFPDNITTNYNTLILTGCLGYDTEIPLLNGKVMKIGELADIAKTTQLDEYVYSFDLETNHFVPGHLINAFSTGVKKVYRITLDSGESFVATSNHKFLTRDKHWKSIDSGLCVGDSLMPLYREHKCVNAIRKDSLYEHIKHPQKDGSYIEEPTHRMVMRYKVGWFKGVVHHKDFNKKNNDPRNLLLTDWNSHRAYHAKKGGENFKSFNEKRKNGELPQEVIDRMNAGGKKGLDSMWSKQEYHDRASERTTKRMLDGLAKEMSDIYWSNPENKIKRGEDLASYNKNEKNIRNYQISKATKIANLAIRDFGELTESTYEETKLKYGMRTGYPSYKSITKRISQEELYERAISYNHTIVDIELVGEQEVFDLTVEKYHNFALNCGIVAHNSIGIGKSFLAVLCMLYLLYRMLCLKDPYTYYGLQPIDKITFSFINVTIDAAKGVAWDKIQQLLQSSPWFMSHGNVSGRSEIIWTPSKRIELVVGSNNNAIIGRALFCLDGDTVILTTDGEYSLKELSNKTINVISTNNGVLEPSNNCTVIPTVKSKIEYEIELDDGTIVKCTPEHRFMLKDGTYKEAQYLTENDELFDHSITYDSFINDIIATRGQWNIPDGEYFEVHHIIPRCMGGEGDIRKCKLGQHHQNLIYLYPREHFIAHMLLVKKYPGNKSIISAWSMMAFPKGKTKRDFPITSCEYEELRKNCALLLQGNTFGKGQKPWNTGLTKENDARLKNIAELARERFTNREVSDETRAKMSVAVKKRYEEHPEQFESKTKGTIIINNGVDCVRINGSDPIPDGWVRGDLRMRGKKKDMTNYYSSPELQAKKHESLSGKNNPMYGNGYKLTGGNNGHAIYIYTFEGVDYFCRDDLMVVLKQRWEDISESTIRRIMSGKYTVRTTKKYQYVIDNLSWRMKTDEDKKH